MMSATKKKATRPHDMDHNGVFLVREAKEQLDLLVMAMENLREVECPVDEDFEKVMEPLRDARRNVRVALENHVEKASR
jgi:hypothetical protein